MGARDKYVEWREDLIRKAAEALTDEQKASIMAGQVVWPLSEGYLPSVTPEGRSMRFYLDADGALIGTWRKAVAIGPDEWAQIVIENWTA